MPNDLRVGLIGANAGYGWGKVAHVPAIAAAHGVTLHAVASRSQAGAEEAATAFSAKLAFSDAEALAASPDVDLVAIAVRAPAHRAAVLAALRHRKPIYCEWPLGSSMAETEEMAGAAADAGVPTAIGLQGRHSPWLVHLRDTIANGAIGHVMSANFVADDELPYDAWAQSNAYMLSEDSGANALTIHGGHYFDSVAFAVGEFAAVSGFAGRSRSFVTMKESGESMPLKVPDQIALAARTEDGAVVGAQIFGGKTPGPAMTLVVQGTHGVLRATSNGYMHWRPLEVAVAANGSNAFSAVPTPDSLFTVPLPAAPGPDYTLAFAYSAFAAAINENRRFRPDFADALLRHRTIDTVAW